jgi:hypothetical protein
MINVSRRRYYDGYELALCECASDGMRWNTDHISVPSALNPDKYERTEFIRVYEKMCVIGWFPALGLYDEWVARSRLR